MPIRINLLTEAHAEEELRRRDPVKQAIYLGVLFVALSLAWFSSTWLKYKLAQGTLNQIEGQIRYNTNANAQVEADLRAIGDSKKRLNALAELTKARFLKGDLLNALQKIYVPNVQLIRLKLDQSYEHKDGTAAKTDKKGTTPARPATSTQKILLTLDARDASSNPGDQVNHYNAALAASAYFSSNLEKINGIRLSNLSPAQSTGKGKPFVLFTLECHFPDITR